jgi:hypothetical protein
MDLLIKIKENTLESDIKNLIVYLKSKNFIKKFQINTNEKNDINRISDKETIEGIHITSTKALNEFLANENESIF